MAVPDRLTALDAAFLELEELEDGALMSIGGVMVFDPPPSEGAPGVEAVRAALVGRLAELPRYAQRLSSAHTGSLAWPTWEDDVHFDIRKHVRHAALPPPGDEGRLCDWTAEFFSHPLDRTRPLWEMVLLDGLENGRWALAHKTHHCLVDGVGSVDVVDTLLDQQRRGRRRALPRESPLPARGSRLPHPPEVVAQATQAGVRAAGSGIHAVMSPRATLHRSRALAELILRDEVIRAPHTSLNVPIGQSRRFAVVRVPLAQLKAIGRDVGGSVNDVLLAACAGGFRRLLLARGETLPPRGLRAMVPVNVRDASEHRALGNRVSSLFVDLPVVEPDAKARLARINASTRRLKDSGAADGPTTAIDLAALIPPALHRAALARVEFSTRLFNVTITNVPGPKRPLYAFGARLREVHPVVPLAAEHAVGIAIFSCNGLVTIGINADRHATPDIDVLASGIEDGIDQLLHLLRTPCDGSTDADLSHPHMSRARP